MLVVLIVNTCSYMKRNPFPFPLTNTHRLFLGLSVQVESGRAAMWLTLKASVRAMSPPVLISFSRMSSRRSLGLSAMYSAIATAPIIQTNTPVIYTFTHAYHKPSSTNSTSSALEHIHRLHDRNFTFRSRSHLHRRVWWRPDPVWGWTGLLWVRL